MPGSLQEPWHRGAGHLFEHGRGARLPGAKAGRARESARKRTACPRACSRCPTRAPDPPAPGCKARCAPCPSQAGSCASQAGSCATSPTRPTAHPAASHRCARAGGSQSPLSRCAAAETRRAARAGAPGSGHSGCCTSPPDPPARTRSPAGAPDRRSPGRNLQRQRSSSAPGALPGRATAVRGATPGACRAAPGGTQPAAATAAPAAGAGRQAGATAES